MKILKISAKINTQSSRFPTIPAKLREIFEVYFEDFNEI